MSRRFLWLLIAAAIAACAGADHPFEPAPSVADGEPALRTDRDAYRIRSDGSVLVVEFDLTYVNPLGRAVAVPTCHSPMRPLLEKLVGDRWEYVHSPVELMCITAPLVLTARSTHTFRYALRVDDWDLRRWLDRGDGALEGTYRLHWFVALHDRRSDNGLGAPLPLAWRVSNSFLLTER